ncbi:MAG TPA: SGNH/GDSL hydrolase family protein [Verrucomicrobiae bacterium]|nr:SGNH/GDSL hydrolase family protein [Verrucomicrobiae bacterium]
MFKRTAAARLARAPRNWDSSRTGGRLVSAILAGAALAGIVSAGASDGKTPAERAIVSEGDTARLMRVFDRARRGEALTVGVIGGSITQGAAATKPENRYGNLVAAWWRQTFPNAKIDFVNAGIGATGSSYGALRAKRDLLSHRPDFVVVEYAVNDGNTQASAETLEGLVRQILKRPNRPALLLLFMMNRTGGSAQQWFVKVGEHYHLPMVSYRDALWPEIEAGRMKWDDISPDQVHPNDRGHAAAAGWVIASLQRALDKFPAAGAPPEPGEIPAPIFTDVYEFTALQEAEALQPVANQGWVRDPKTKSWTSDRPGSMIEFEIAGRIIFGMHYVIKGPMGRAQVTADGGARKTLEGWFNQTWGGYRQTNPLAADLSTGTHRLRFELLPTKAEGSTGHEFRILGLGAAGLAPDP